MKFKIVKIKNLSGPAAKIYSVVLEGEDGTLFANFLQQYRTTHPAAIKDIAHRLQMMGKKEGAREQYFKLKEGKLGDGVCALYDTPDKNLRLYCIRFGGVAIVLGGGGEKKVRAYQEDPILNRQAEIMKYVSQEIMKAQSEKDIKLTANGELVGKLIFNDEENEDEE
ncbi:hypothetical protein [uncultured Rikenella sp.]|uniref:hypothetical protein n=1 Tax=uncultured Rikenella sp. TaxID=368003 RepID=UPI0025D06D33|nr:hypothetical protein [uncultured Rikenella sp.]